MLKQLLAASTEIALPDHSIKDPYTKKLLNVTQAKTLTYQSIAIEQAGFDAVISKDNYQLGIFISYHPGRSSIPEASGNIKGIVQLDITHIEHIKQKSQVLNSKKFLDSLIAEQSEIKSWYWHVNQEARLKACKREHLQQEAKKKELLNSDNQYYSDTVKRPTNAYQATTANMIKSAGTKMVYRCYTCRIDYPKTNATNTCPVCEHELWQTETPVYTN